MHVAASSLKGWKVPSARHFGTGWVFPNLAFARAPKARRRESVLKSETEGRPRYAYLVETTCKTENVDGRGRKLPSHNHEVCQLAGLVSVFTEFLNSTGQD